MSYQWIDDHRHVPKTRPETLGERRTDRQTEEKIRDALRARSVHAAAGRSWSACRRFLPRSSFLPANTRSATSTSTCR